MNGLACPFPLVPPSDSKTQLAQLVQGAVQKAFPDAGEVRVELERPKNADHGDFSTNVALQLARRVGKKPREAAEAIVAAIARNEALAKADIAGPGFINFTLSAASRFAALAEIHRTGAAYGRSEVGDKRKFMVE